MNKPSKIYATQLEDTALEQYTSAMEQDYVVKGALMADAHTGYGLPIGAVMETTGVIVPSWVGFDIGCGMCALQTVYDRKQIEQHANQIFDEIYRQVPTGFNVHQHPKKTTLDPEKLTLDGQEIFEKRKGFRHLGTLGSGNHFIEIGYDLDDNVWIVIHSGSRGVGHGIASHYMKIASGDGKARDGHLPLRMDTEAGQAYANDLQWATQFALENRTNIMCQTLTAIDIVLNGGGFVNLFGMINRNHNHAELLGNGNWIHRKGATHAEAGMSGVIPGNMRDGSFIVKGKGNPESLCSSSHGAGRVMGRKQAKRELSMDLFKSQMKGIVAKMELDTLDESPMAYKGIFEVMSLQRDLVEVVTYVKPIINIKA